MPTPPKPAELDAVVTFIATQQRVPERNTPSLGTDETGIAAELRGLEPPWATTARVLRGEGGITGAVVVEWDAAVGRAWILGPWVAAPGSRWQDAAASLLDAALAQIPPGITRHEISGDVANEQLARLAASRGWTATEVNHVLVADRDAVESWQDEHASGVTVRPAVPDDVPAIAPLHESEFPATYASASQLVDGQTDGSRTVLVAERSDGSFCGYAAGELHEDGEGYIDYVVVAPDARRSGTGRQLVMALTRHLIDQAPTDRVSLTVQDHRSPARTLYRRLGFRAEASFRGYRSWTDEA